MLFWEEFTFLNWIYNWSWSQSNHFTDQDSQQAY